MKKLILICVLLSGCASLPPGVQMTDAERAACESQACSVWTVDELRKLISISIKKGYEAGKGSL
jgi:starvation-inducible outer membrane lipoprotein